MVEIYMMNRMNSLNWTLLNLHFVVSFLLVFYCYCVFVLHFKTSFCSSMLSLVLSINNS